MAVERVQSSPGSINNGCSVRRSDALLRIAALFPALLLCAGAETEGLLAEARSLRRGGDLEGAVQALVRVADGMGGTQGADAAEVFRAIGEIRLEQGRALDALKRFEQAVAVAPGLSVAHYQAGLAGRAAGDEGSAAQHLAEALRLGFRAGAARMHLAAA